MTLPQRGKNHSANFLSNDGQNFFIRRQRTLGGRGSLLLDFRAICHSGRPVPSFYADELTGLAAFVFPYSPLPAGTKGFT
jgi:hypothetical protein